MKLEVDKTSLGDARTFADEILVNLGGVDKNFPNFDKNYILLQRWAEQGHTLRKDMPRIPRDQVKDFQNALAKGKLDIAAPFSDFTKLHGQLIDGLKGKDAKEFLKAGTKDGEQKDDVVKTTRKDFRAIDLIPIQKQIYLDSAVGKKILKLGVDGFKELAKKAELIVSADGYIIDGHHRTATSILIDPNLKLHALVVDLPIKKLLKLARAYGSARGNKPNESVLSFKHFLRLDEIREITK